jgi:hypothetical protein
MVVFKSKHRLNLFFISAKASSMTILLEEGFLLQVFLEIGKRPFTFLYAAPFLQREC